jgi:hypothetical protein
MGHPVKQVVPPRPATKILLGFCRRHCDAVIGDLMEEHLCRARSASTADAWWWY